MEKSRIFGGEARKARKMISEGRKRVSLWSSDSQGKADKWPCSTFLCLLRLKGKKNSGSTKKREA